MHFIFIILLTIALWLIFWPRIKTWMRHRAEEKLADYLRAQMGMPTSAEQRRREKEANRRSRQQARSGFWSAPEHEGTSPFAAPENIIPREYAVDVEFVEIREFSSDTVIGRRSKVSFTIERQVSDVAFTEIRLSK